MWIQWIVDLFLSWIFGYKTKTGPESQRREAETVYEKSAQIVSIFLSKVKQMQRKQK